MDFFMVVVCHTIDLLSRNPRGSVEVLKTGSTHWNHPLTYVGQLATGMVFGEPVMERELMATVWDKCVLT